MAVHDHGDEQERDTYMMRFSTRMAVLVLIGDGYEVDGGIGGGGDCRL